LDGVIYYMSIYALVTGTPIGVVVNTVICENDALASSLWPEYVVVNITEVVPQPGINWYLSGSSWLHPDTSPLQSGSI
jgi:hypothetical protein